jgi:antigen 43
MTNTTVSSGQAISGGAITSGNTTTVLSGAVISQTDIYSGGSLVVSGADYNTTLMSGGSETVAAGGSSYYASIQSAGSLLVQAGGSATHETIASGGTLEIASGGTINDIDLVSGATLTLDPGAVVAPGSVVVFHIENGQDVSWPTNGASYIGKVPTIVSVEHGGIARQTDVVSGGSLNVAGTSYNATLMSDTSATIENSGSALYTVVSSGAAMAVQSGGLAIHTQIDCGGAMVVQSGGVINDVDLMSGGLLTLQSGASAAAGSLIVFHGATTDGSPSGLIVAGGAGGNVLPNVVIQGFGAGNTIAVQDGDNGGPSAVTWVQTATNEGTLTLTYAGVSYDFTLSGQYQTSSFTVTDDASTGRTIIGAGTNATDGSDTAHCFLPGTAIATPDGLRAVETLAAGDLVMTRGNDGTPVAAELVWAGAQVISAARHGHPVCIRANALADGVPSRDLFVTPEHCIFHDGGFIPARMLVNGRSIFSDEAQATYTVHHVETGKHAIVLSENLWSETFLDTGDALGRRAAFAAQGSLARRIGPVKTWVADAAVPLTTGRDVVEPLYRAIEARAEAAGLADTRVPAETTDEADLHLVTEDGRTISALRRADDVVLFRLPAGVTRVWLASRADQPAAAIGPFVDDRRTLGVLVGQVTLWDSGETRAVSAHLDTDVISGWVGREAVPMRWTAGHAQLDLGARAPHSIGLLGVQIVAAGPYRCDRVEDVALSA